MAIITHNAAIAGIADRVVLISSVIIAEIRAAPTGFYSDELTNCVQ